MLFFHSFAMITLAVLALIVSVGEAFWRMPCMSRSGLARIDPLVSFGGISEHAHAIHGSSAFSPTSGHDQLVAGECTSCEVSQDKSAYWTPALYFQNAATGQFQLVQQVGGMLAYYLLYPNAQPTDYPNVTAFPAGFQMIAGDSGQRNFSNYPVPDIPKSNWNQEPYNTQAFLRQAALGFNCLNYAAPPEGSLYRHFLPDKAYLDANCLDGVRFELMFPSCWNGSHDSLDHKSHVAYPSEVMTGDCPAEYPQRLVSLFYETIWNTHEFVGVDGQFMLANGDPTGYGYHGDFIMGWDEDFLQDAVNECTNLSGQISDCPLFNIQDASVWATCNITEPTDLASDNVVGPASILPGNAPIFSGPARAGGAGAPANTGSGSSPTAATSAAIVPTLSYSSGISLSSGDTYVPGAVFAVSTHSSASPGPSPTTTSAPAPPPAPSSSVSYFSTGFTTSGLVVQEVLWVEEVVTVTAPVPTTNVIEARDRAQGHVHKHRHAGH